MTSLIRWLYKSLKIIAPIPTCLATSSLSGISIITDHEIRKEFEYNLSQQLYLSENAWEVTVNFKDNIITLINSAATSCPPQATASDLARKILEHYISSDLKGDQILKIVKAEIQ